jgi:hypothetical protein
MRIHLTLPMHDFIQVVARFSHGA